VPFNQVMPKFKAGTLKSGKGPKVTSRGQAIAIMLSEKKAADSGNDEFTATVDRKPKSKGVHAVKGLKAAKPKKGVE
jgi:hypothetical protein